MAKYFTSELQNYRFEPEIWGSAGDQITRSRWQAIRTIVHRKIGQCPGAARVLHDTRKRKILITGPHTVLMAEPNIQSAIKSINNYQELQDSSVSWGENFLGEALMCTRSWMRKNFHQAGWERVPKRKVTHETDSESEDESQAVDVRSHRSEVGKGLWNGPRRAEEQKSMITRLKGPKLGESDREEQLERLIARSKENEANKQHSPSRMNHNLSESGEYSNPGALATKLNPGADDMDIDDDANQ